MSEKEETSAAAVNDKPAANGKPAVSGAGAGTAARPRTPWYRLAVLVLFGIVYAWDLFAAFTNFFGKLDEIGRINQVRELNGFPVVDVPWIPLVLNLALPVIVFGLAVWIARRRSVGVLAVVLVAGLGVVAALSLSIIAYVRATS